MDEPREFAAFVGIDWADQEHAFCILPVDEQGTTVRGVLPQKAEAIAAWAGQLREQFHGRPIALCLEQSRGPLLYALMAYELLVLYPINPVQLAAYRKALDPSGAKNDPRDGELLARFVRDHRDQLRVWRPDDEITRSLRLLSEQRRAWVQQRVALENELRQRLKETYPQALELFAGDLHAERVLAFLAKFPTLKELQRASPQQLAKCLRKPRRRCDEVSVEELQRRQVQAIRQAVPLTQDSAILQHARLVICHLVLELKSLNRAVADCEQDIAERFAQHPDRDLFSSFPGAGESLAPRLAAAFGTDRDKFENAQQIQQLSGIAPITRSSGKTRIVQARYACPRFLRQTFHEFARCSINYSAWARAYVDMRQAAGTAYQIIVRALAFKWQRILFHCWKNRQPYDEKRYLQSLRAARSRILSYLPSTAGETS